MRRIKHCTAYKEANGDTAWLSRHRSAVGNPIDIVATEDPVDICIGGQGEE